MDPSKSKQTERVPAPNGRAPTQLQVRHEGRKPLFGSSTNSQDSSGAGASGKGKGSPEQAGASGNVRQQGTTASGFRQQSSRRTNSESRLPSISASNNGPGSPGAARIARPSSTNSASRRRPMTLTQAFKMAENEEYLHSDGDDDQDHPMDGSPSPAPRPWRTRPVVDQNVIRQELGKDHLDTKGPGGTGKAKLNGERAGQDDGKALSSGESSSWRDRADWRARLDTGGESQDRPPVVDDPISEGADIPALVPGIDDIPLPSVETADEGYGFQIEDDFTAGDLQVSDSPRIRMTNRPFANRLPFDESSNIDINSRTRVNNPGAKNTRLDELRTWEVRTGNDVPVGRSPPKASKSKVDGIRDLEVEVESKIPLPDRSLTTPRSSKIDSIIQREANPLSNRQLAQIRLAEIKEQNAMSRDLSPEKKRLPPARSLHSELVKAGSASAEPKLASPAKTPYGVGGTRIPDTPVTVYKNRRNREVSGGSANGNNDQNDKQKAGRNEQTESKRPGTAPRGGQHGLLQQLARATSSSPGPEPEREVRRAPLGRNLDKGIGGGSSSAASRRLNRAATSDNVGSRARAYTRDANEEGKPRVGFVGIRRTRSTESTRSKRSSLHSDGDPVDRIEAEAKLFALTDNHSERGPSPLPEDKDSEGEGAQEATPRARKEDPLSMPTPKITGAYVETPAPAPASEKKNRFNVEMPAKAQFTAQNKSTCERGSEADPRDTASDPGTSDTEQIKTKRAPPPRRHSHSLPRMRPPPKNSANPPTVKDDIKVLRHENNIDDSTIDDFDDMLDGNPKLRDFLGRLPPDLESIADSADDESFKSKMEQSIAAQQIKAEEKGKDESHKERPSDETEDTSFAAYGRMAKSLTTTLYGIHETKKGIDRIRDTISNSQHHSHTPIEPADDVSDTKPHEQKQPEPADLPPKKDHDDDNHSDHSQCTQCASYSSHTVVNIPVPVPHLYNRKPHFRLTFLGWLVFLTSLWTALEYGMCAMYCSPSSCSSPPCIWSYDDPSFGVALPVKVDQWATGGTGRVLINHATEEFRDWFADVLDTALGRDIREVDLASLSFEGRRTHRRRLRKKGIDNATQHNGGNVVDSRGHWADLDFDDDDFTSIGGDKRMS
jgi:hypothetical protein